MPDVPNSTLEAEQDFDYSNSYSYDYGILETAFVGTVQVATESSGEITAAVGSVAGTTTVTSDSSGATAGGGAIVGTAETQTTVTSTVTTIGEASGVATATTTTTGTLTAAESDVAPTQWQLTVDGDVEDAVYDVDPVVDTANPFGDFAVAKIDDRGGEKFSQYPRGTRVEAAVSDNNGITFNTKFTGYVVERRETEQSGADALEVEAYSFDQFLRRNTVTNDQLGNTITEALADIIQTDTPVSYVAGNVDVGDDQELTRSYQGESVENVLRDLAFKSNNEEFGVNDDLEFFFRPRESTHIDRGIDNSQWFNYDIPELGKQAINEVEVWFDGGDESVIVDDGTDKLDLQDNLNLPEPGTQRAELNRPELTNIADAEDEGRKYLEFRNATLSGTVTTYGLYDAQPGDTIDIEIAARGIDSEFVIAATEYRWGRDETILTIIEKRGETDGILTELNDSVQRQEMADADRDAPSNRITTTNATALVDVQVDADGNTPDSTRFVNDGRRKVRDGWADKGNVAISTLEVGDDGSGLSRSNTALANETASASVTDSLPDSTSVEFTASITETGVEELGLETSDGTLIARAVFATPVDIDGAVSVTLAVSNDDSVSRGVLTNDGQTATRDILADSTPALPDGYAYGTDGSTVSESDTALGAEAVDVSLNEVLIESASTQSDFESLVPEIPADKPLTVSGGEVKTLPTCYFREGEDRDDRDFGQLDNNTPGLSDGQGFVVGVDDEGFVAWEFEVEHTIPESAFEVAVRDYEFDDSDFMNIDVEWIVELEDGTTEVIDNMVASSINLSWREVGQGFYGDDGWNSGDIPPGTHRLIADVVSTGGADTDKYGIDAVAPRDGRFTYNFDNTTDANGYLSGPELFPEAVTQSFETTTTRRDVTEAKFNLTAPDVSDNFYVELANDGSTFTRVNNSTTGSVTFASPDRGVDTNIQLGRYGSRTTATPTEGYLGQSINEWSLTANPDAVVPDNIGVALTRAVIPPDTIAGTTIREAGLKSGSTLLTRHQLAEFTLESGQRLASSESTQFTGDET